MLSNQKTRNRRTTLFSLLISVALLLSSCSSTTNNQSDDQGPQGQEKVEVFFVGDTPRGFRLFSEIREFPAGDDLAESVISQLISGQITPLDPDYANLWDNSHRLNSISYEGSQATVDIDLGKLNVGSEGELRAIEQIVWTLIGISPEITTLRFTVNGKTVETLAGHVDVQADFTRSPEYEVLNPIQIESINDGDQASNPLTISGMACTFEANVVWTLFKDGQMIEEGFTTAAAACPERSDWSILLNSLEPGSYRFEAKEFSAEDGSLFAIDSKQFVIK